MRRPQQPYVTPTAQASADWAEFYALGDLLAAEQSWTPPPAHGALWHAGQALLTLGVAAAVVGFVWVLIVGIAA